jgi:hypothetical protein
MDMVILSAGSIVPHGGKAPPMRVGDRFEGQVYRIETMDLFHTLDYHAAPSEESWVAVERLPNGKLIIERFWGQPYIGVVRVLNFYRIRRSVQWNPKMISASPD